MSISNNSVVSIHYTLTDDEGTQLDSSREAEPLTYLHGAQNIIPGLENALAGKKVGDAFNVAIDPAEGYGEHQPQLIQEVPRSAFQGIDSIEIGMQFQTSTEQGPMNVVVSAVTDEMVTVDANHPLAGKVLTFDVSVEEIREASEEEIQHGHVHGPDGHHH